MLQEDSSGEASFEIIDRKINESPKSFGKSDSHSSLSSAVSVSSTNVPTAGNLFSNVAPPSTLPDFTLWQGGQTIKPPIMGPQTNTSSVPSTIMPPSVRKAMSQPRSIVPPSNMPMSTPFAPMPGIPDNSANPLVPSVIAPVPASQMPPMQNPPNVLAIPPIQPSNVNQEAINLGGFSQPNPNVEPQMFQPQQSFVNIQPGYSQFPTNQFSAAIPPSKSFHGTSSMSNYNEEESALSGAGFRNWLSNMRDAVNSSGIISKVVEKTKSSVDTIITTLDPQMSEVIYSGGDLEFVVVSQNEEEIASIREAVHSIFGKAWINGMSLNLPDAQEYSPDLQSAINRGVWKINESLNFKKNPTVAIQNILLQVNESWFEQTALVIKDPERNLILQNFTQTIPIPVSFVNRAFQMPEHAGLDQHKALSSYLNKLGLNWQQPVFGISRRDILSLTARMLVKFYKNHL